MDVIEEFVLQEIDVNAEDSGEEDAADINPNSFHV